MKLLLAGKIQITESTQFFLDQMDYATELRGEIPIKVLIFDLVDFYELSLLERKFRIFIEFFVGQRSDDYLLADRNKHSLRMFKGFITILIALPSFFALAEFTVKISSILCQQK